MMRLPRFGCLFLFVLLLHQGLAQDFSNKGKDFWVGYGYHVRMITGNGGSQQMVLYFATESVTSVTVSIPRLGYSATYANIPANTVFTSNPLPKLGAQDATLTSEGISDKGIHITSDKPIVAYAHIYDGNVSGATLLFPTNTLGREYYSLNYNQVSNENRSNSWFYAVAVDSGTTVVQITPSANTLTRPAGQPYTVNLQQGQIINVMGELISTGIDPFTGVDLSGSTIKSISSGTTGCKRIAVFSGSGKISVSCNNNSSSADNYIVQAFPRSAWGKRYLTTPTRNFTNNFYRVAVTDPTTVVRLNGQLMSGLVNNFFYEFSSTSPSLIESDQPVLVAQYVTSQSACGNGVTDGDPEVIYLSPVEQNIDRVILNSTQNFAITQHFINVVIRNSAVASFRLDGNPVAGFMMHPQDAGFAYAQLQVGPGNHRLQADSGFNAIAYGYGQFESYGYNAGTNVKDLYQFVSVHNRFATVSFPAACKNSPFQFSMTFPYQPKQIKWVFGPALNALGLADVTLNSPTFDSTWLVNDKQLYRYRLPNFYQLPVTGTFPIKLVAQNSTEEGCSGEQEIDYDLQVFERPAANFNFSTTGCLSDPVFFTDNSNLNGRQSTKWNWDFGDGQGSASHQPSHQYSSAGTYPVRFSLISDIGCVSDTAMKNVILTNPPLAKFGIAAAGCVGRAMIFTDSSSLAGGTITKWTWSFGDNTPVVVVNNSSPQTHVYNSPGTFTVTLELESTGGCKSAVFTRQVTIADNPVAAFSFGSACLPAANIQFKNESTIAGGGNLQYSWSFGDGGLSSEKDPVYTYTAAGPFLTKLVVSSPVGCKDSLTKSVTTVYAPPMALFSTPSEVCVGSNVSFGDQSTGGAITSWEWDFGDGSPFSTVQNPVHQYALAGTYAVKLKVESSVGCASILVSKTIIVNSIPVADFSVSTPNCANSEIKFTNTSVANAGTIAVSAWDFGDGSPSSNQSSPTHIYKNSGNYTVSLQVETNKGCKSSIQTKQVRINPSPDAGFIVPGTCINDPVSTFLDTSAISDGSEAQFRWLWNFGDPNASMANNVSTAQNGEHRYTATGIYNVSLTVTSRDGCASTKTQSFSVNGAIPLPQFSFPSGVEKCSNDSIIVQDNSSVTPGNLVKLEIYWDYNNNPVDKLTIDQPVRGAIYKHLYPAFFSPAAKTYRIKLVVYSGINCLTEKDTTVTVLANPELRFLPVEPVCISRPAFVLQAGAVNSPGSGIFTGRGISATGLFDPAAAGTGNHLIRYTFTGTNGCINTQEQVISVLPVPVVSAGPDKVILEGGAATLEGSANGVGLTYSWTPGTALSSVSALKPAARPTNDILYRLTVSTADGCSAFDEVLVKVLKAPSIPNAFSPNGDGVHDRWEIQYLDSYPGATVEIFNRYGQKVFESRGYAKPWDGTLNGSALPVGTYYYLIDPKNGRKPMAGYVDLIR